MDLDLLKKRVELVDKNIEQLMANLNMLNGGKQELLYWITQLEKPAEIENKEVSEAVSV